MLRSNPRHGKSVKMLPYFILIANYADFHGYSSLLFVNSETVKKKLRLLLKLCKKFCNLLLKPRTKANFDGVDNVVLK